MERSVLSLQREMSRAAGAKQSSESQKNRSSLGNEGSQGQGRNTVIQLAKLTVWEGARHDWSCGKSTSKTQSYGQSFEVLEGSFVVLTSGSKRLVKSRVNCNGLQLCGHRNFAKDVGKAVLGRRLALLGPVGQCASAHSVHLLECTREIMGRMASSFSS